MPTKKSHANSHDGESENHLVFLNAYADFVRHQLAMMNECASALFRGTEAIRKIQQEAAHQAAAHHTACAEKLKVYCDPAELSSIESDLLRKNSQIASQYWQQLNSAALQTEIDVMNSGTKVLSEGETGGVNSVFKIFQAAIPSANEMLSAKK